MPNDQIPAQGQGRPSPPPPATSQVRWPRVKEILHRALIAWQQKNGRKPKLRDAHGNDFIDEHEFLGWETKKELLKAVASIQDDPKKYPLIQAGKAGRETYLILALTTGVPMEGGGNYPPMPDGGPPVSKGEVDEIVSWIDSGMPD